MAEYATTTNDVRRTAHILAGIGLATALTLSAPLHAVVSLERSINHDGKTVVFEQISAMLAGAEDTLLVLDAERGTLTEFKGAAGASHILSGGKDKAFDSDDVRALAALGSGQYLISNAGDDSVVVVDGSGKKISLIAKEGSAAGNLINPHGIAWSSNRRMYIAEGGNNRISVFGDDGVFIQSFGQQDANEAERLDEPSQLAVDAKERVYVLEARNSGIITIFSDSGARLKRYTSNELKAITGNLPKISALTVDNAGLMYLADNANGRVYQIDWQAGKLLSSFGSKGEQRGQYEDMTALALLPGERLAVADSGNKKIDIYRLQENAMPALEPTRLPTVGFERSIALKCSAAYRLRGGNVLCLDDDSNKVGTFNASGRAETEFKGEFSKPLAASVYDQDVVILDDESIKIYQLDGGLRYQAGAPGHADGQLDSPQGVFMDREKIYVADTGNQRIQIFTKDGIFLERIGSRDDDEKTKLFSEPTRVVVDANENLYVLDKETRQVLVFSPAHKLLYKIGGETPADKFESIIDIAVDADNNLYLLVAVSGNASSVQVYNGPSRVISFGAHNESNVGMQSPQTLSIAPEPKTVVSVYDKDKQALINYKYLQLPAKLGGLDVAGNSKQVKLSWQKVPGSYISRYKIYATRDASDPFKYITDVGTTEAVIEHKDDFTNTQYRVSAVSGFSVEGEPSNIREDAFQAGFALYRDLKYSEALAVFSAAFAADKNNGELLKYMGLASLELGKVEDAVAYLRELTQLPGYEVEGRNLHVRALVTVKDYVAARAVIDQVIANNTASVDTIVYCGELSLQLGDAIGAVNCLEKALAQQPDNIKAHFLIGKAYVKLGLAAKGLEEFDKAVALDAENAEVWYQSGSVFQEMGEHDKAITSLHKALELKPDYSDAQLALAQSQLQLKQYDAVRTLAIKLAGNKDTEAQGQYLLGVTALATGNDTEALLALNKATRADAHYTTAWLALADTYIKLNQQDKVRGVLENAYKGDVHSFEAAKRFGELDYAAGEYALAVPSLQRALGLKPDDYDTAYQLADAEYRSGAYKQADTSAQTATKLKPDAWQPLLLQADIANKQGKNGRAIDLIKQAMASEKNSAVLTTRLGGIYVENGMFDLAKDTLGKAALLDASSAQPYVLLGALYMQRRSFDDAITALDKAVALDASAENKLALDTAYAEKKKSQEFKSNAPRVVLKNVQLDRVFSAAYKQYADKPVGNVLVANNSAQDYGNLKLTFTIKGYMDFPTTVDIAELKANSEQSIALTASFNNRILEIDEDTGVQAEIAINFIRDGQNDAISVSQPMTIYGKNAIVWGEANMVGSFVTPKDDLLRDFVRGTINENKPKADAIDNNLLTAMTLFDAFGAYGIKYVVDPNSPYSKVTETSVDYVQFGRETLKLRSGDCDDLSVLLSASLENLGIETAILDVPGHLLMMFNTGLPEAQRGLISLDDDLLVIRDGKVWLPVEATMVGQTFAEAWAEGARKYREHSASNKLTAIELAQAWETFKPVTLRPATYTLELPQKAHVTPIVSREKDLLLEKSLDRLVSPYRAMASVDPSNIKARMQIAITYAKYGLHAAAEREFDAIEASDPDNSAVHNNRGNIHFNKGDFERAIENYRYAEKLASNDAGIKMNLSMAHYKQGELTLASAKYKEAGMIDAGISKQFAGYVKLLSQ